MDNLTQGKLFSNELMKEVRTKFHHLESDPLRPGRRLYFDNAGGAFRLKSALEAFYALDSMPDCMVQPSCIIKRQMLWMVR